MRVWRLAPPHPEEPRLRGVSKDGPHEENRRVGKGALAPCPPLLACSRGWARVRFAHPTAPRDAENIRPHSRGGFSPEVCNLVVPLWTEGAGKAGRRLRPHRRVLKAEKMHTDLTGTAETSRLSPRDGFTAYFVLSPVSGLYCHRCRPRTGGADRRQGRGARTTRLRRPLRRFRPVKRSPDVTASIASQAQRIVTIAKRPSVGRETDD
jgi:hypothetical protein